MFRHKSTDAVARLFKLNNKIQYLVDSYISSDYFTYCLGVDSQDGTKRKRALKTRLEDDAEATGEAPNQPGSFAR